MKSTMLSSFRPEELDCLTKHFRLTTKTSPDRIFSIASVDLLDKAKCLAYLDRVTNILESSSKAEKVAHKVAIVSQFSKRYGFLTFGSGLYAMTMFNKGLDYSVENCHIESIYKDNTWLPDVRLADWNVTQPMDGDRNEWRDQIIENIFAENIAKVWRSISNAANIPISVLWENVAISVYWLYEKRIGEGASDNQKSRIHEDYQYLLNAPASLFGETENPLTRFNSPKCTKATSDLLIRIRKTCCYLYRISPDQVYCTTCPRN
jgi:ferric iron reductase protein FhuF